MGTNPWFFGTVDVYGPQTGGKKQTKKKNSAPDQFLYSDVSVCNNVAERMLNTVVSY